MTAASVNGMASAQSGCLQCHGSKVALKALDGGAVTVDDLKPGPDGLPTQAEAVARIRPEQRGPADVVGQVVADTGDRTL